MWPLLTRTGHSVRASAVCRIIQNTFIAFVVATLWPKPHLNQDSEAMGTIYAAILFFSLVRKLNGTKEYCLQRIHAQLSSLMGADLMSTVCSVQMNPLFDA